MGREQLYCMNTVLTSHQSIGTHENCYGAINCWVTWFFIATPPDNWAFPWYGFLFTMSFSLSQVFSHTQRCLLPTSIRESASSLWVTWPSLCSPWWRALLHTGLLFMKQIGCDPDTAFARDKQHSAVSQCQKKCVLSSTQLSRPELKTLQEFSPSMAIARAHTPTSSKI